MLSTATLLLILHYPGSFSIYAWMDNFQKDYPVFSVKLYRFRFYIDCKDYPFPLSSNSPEWFSVTLLSFIQPKDTCLRWVNSFGQENSSFEPQVLTCLPACWVTSVVSNFLWPLWTIACQAPLSMLFSRQEYRSGLPFPSPGDLPNPGTEPASCTSPALTGRFFTTSTT